MKSCIVKSLFGLAIYFYTSCSFAQSYSLFNGKDLSGWHVDVPEKDTNSTAINPFIIRNGMLVSLGTPQGHLITDSVY
ncbi:MAG: family 16 glycoside hydrolase, partial [Chitinophagaceae bacterium]